MNTSEDGGVDGSTAPSVHGGRPLPTLIEGNTTYGMTGFRPAWATDAERRGVPREPAVA